MMKFTLSLIAVTHLCFVSAFASVQPDDVPSCYDAVNLTEFKPVTGGRNLIVIVDQTVSLDENLKKSVHEQVEQFIQPGDQVQLVAFSANAGGKYTSVVYNGKFDSLLTADARNSIGKMTLNKFDACMKAQPKAKVKLHQKLRDTFGVAGMEFPKTELVGSLFQISNDLISHGGQGRKVVLIVSDMFENSNVTSFYSKNRVRKIEAEIEIAKFNDAGIRADFGGADIYVVGAGFAGMGVAYSSQQALSSLELFWQKLFSANNGNLRQFGKPQLLSPMQ